MLAPAPRSGNLPERRWSRALYRRLWQLWHRLRPRDNGLLRVRTVLGAELVVLPGVFDGARLRTGAFLAETLNATVCPPDGRALDLGTGSGLGAIVAARYAARSSSLA
jgi:16S rRNA G1207 methylase RsmC